jgi:hypothetical protein
LESWQLLVTATLEDYTLSSSLHPLLLSGNTYWVLEFFTGGGSGDTIEWGRSSSAPAGGIWSGDSAASLSLGFPSFPVAALQVNGTPVSEPSSLVLLGSAVLSLGVWRRRGLRHRQARRVSWDSSRDFLVKEVVHEFTLKSAILSESSATDCPQETPKAHSETKYVFLHMFICKSDSMAVRFIAEQNSPDLIRERGLFENGILDAA